MQQKFSFINILGFAFGISICLTITLFIAKEHSFDRYHEHADQIVRLYDADKNSSFIDYRVKDLILENFSEAENACLVQWSNRPINVNINERGSYVDGLLSVDNAFFQVFTIPLINGNSSAPFAI